MEKWLSMVPGRRIADAAELKGVRNIRPRHVFIIAINFKLTTISGLPTYRPMCSSLAMHVAT